MWNCINIHESKGARAFIQGMAMADNPYTTSYFYKEWANGFRKAKEWTPELRQQIANSYNIEINDAVQ